MGDEASGWQDSFSPHRAPAGTGRSLRNRDGGGALASAPKIVLGAVALLAAALFVRLGVWQLDRHQERTAGLQARAARAALPPIVWSAGGDVPGDTTGLLGRRVRLEGTWDRAREVILRSRTAGGRAGVEVLSPLRVGAAATHAAGGGGGRAPDDSHPVVMVLRGWLPAPDGLGADLTSGWSDAGPEDARVGGVLISSRDGRGGPPLWVETTGSRHLALAGIDLAQIREQLGLQVSPHVVRADEGQPATAALAPAREVETGSGPHLSYAIQWFAFALIALVGTAILIGKERGREPPKVL